MIKKTNARITITLSKKTLAKISQYSEENGFTKTEIIKMALASFLKDKEK